MWDLDGAITNANAHIYGRQSKRQFQQSAYESVILNHPDFRAQYNSILLGMTAEESNVSPDRGRPLDSTCRSFRAGATHESKLRNVWRATGHCPIVLVEACQICAKRDRDRKGSVV